MDEAANRYARELIDAIHAAVAQDPAVQACRERARAAGHELKISLDAVVGVVGRDHAAARAGAAVVPPSRRVTPADRPYDITAAIRRDRRNLRSLRIAAAETTEQA